MKKLIPFFAILVLLSSCSSDDDSVLPSHFDFQLITELDATQLDQEVGILGSAADNSIYLAHRSVPHGNAERILRVDLSDNSSTEKLYGLTDFVTKRLHFAGGELAVIGGRHINTYAANIEDDPVTVEHGARLTRFGSFQYEGELYIFGGDLDEADADKIKKWNTTNSSFETVATLPEPRFWTDGEVVNGNLYVFGGQQAFASGGFAEDDIYMVNLEDFSVETLRLPEDYQRVFVTSIDHNIFVAGQVWRANETVTRLGIFDTRDNSFREVTYSLDDTGLNSIFGLTSIGNSLYAIHGDSRDLLFTLQRISF